jgi:hypothetical protein
MKRFLEFTAIACLSLVILFGPAAGCKSTPAPGGFYAPTNALGQAASAPDKAFYVADGSFATAYAALDATFTFERENRTALWKVSPSIKHALDDLRPKAVEARNIYIAARQAYLANPVPANLTALKTALTRVQQLSAAVVAALP